MSNVTSDKENPIFWGQLRDKKVDTSLCKSFHHIEEILKLKFHYGTSSFRSITKKSHKTINFLKKRLSQREVCDDTKKDFSIFFLLKPVPQTYWEFPKTYEFLQKSQSLLIIVPLARGQLTCELLLLLKNSNKKETQFNS